MKNKKYKRTISKKTAYGLTLLGLFMIICVAACVAFIYQNQLDRNYKSLTKSYGKSASDFIDGDYVEKIVKTPDKERAKFFDDKYYKEVQKFLDTIERDSDIKYYYVFEPRDNNLKYLWDSDTIQEPENLTTSDEDYMTDGKAFSQKAFKKSPEIDIRYFDDETYGKIVSSFYPIYNSKGDPVALVGVDISTPYIIERLLHFIIAVILAVLVVTAIAVIAWYRFLKKGLIVPLHTLNDASKNMVANLEEDTEVEIEGVGEVGLYTLLKRRQYGKIYLMLGLNEIWAGPEEVAENYKELLTKIRELAPDALIFIQANLYVSASYAEDEPVFSNDNIRALNRNLSKLANGKDIFYIDVNPLFEDENGNLNDEHTGDGAHVYASLYQEWDEWLKTRGIVLKKPELVFEIEQR